MTRTAWTPGVLLAALLASPILAQDATEQIKQLDAQRRKLEMEERTKLQSQLSKIRTELAAGADLAAVRAAVQTAQKSLDQKLAGDAEIQAATKTEKDAADALTKAEGAAAGSDAGLQALKKDLAAATAKVAQAQLEQRNARSLLDQARERLSASPEAKDAAAKAAAAEKAYRDADKTSAPVAAAAKALAEATKAYDEKRKLLPEYKAVQDAQQAYDKLLQTDPGVQAAKTGRDAARKAYEDKLAALLAADAQGPAQIKKLKDADDAVKTAHDAARDTQAKLAEADRAAVSKDPKVVEARKALDAARTARRDAVAQRSAAEKKALTDATQAFNKALDAKLATDEKATAAAKALQDVDARIKDISDQVRKLRRPTTQTQPGK
jgi:hypothetical protein